MPGKSEKMTGVGGITALGAKGVWVGASGVNAGVAVLFISHPEKISKMVRLKIIRVAKFQNPIFGVSFTIFFTLLFVAIQIQLPGGRYLRPVYPSERVWGLLRHTGGKKGAYRVYICQLVFPCANVR